MRVWERVLIYLNACIIKNHMYACLCKYWVWASALNRTVSVSVYSDEYQRVAQNLGAFWWTIAHCEPLGSGFISQLCFSGCVQPRQGASFWAPLLLLVSPWRMINRVLSDCRVKMWDGERLRPKTKSNAYIGSSHVKPGLHLMHLYNYKKMTSLLSMHPL